MIHENWAYVSAFIFFFGSFRYLVETARGKVQPNRVTWFIWGLAPLIAFFAQLGEGVTLQESLITFMAGFVPLLILFASFLHKNAYWKISRLDIICGILSLLGLVLWLRTGTGVIAIVFAILADFLAALPTIIKSYRFPETEDWTLYFFQTVSALIALLVIKDWTIQTVAFSLYLFLDCALLAVLIKFRVGKRLV
jgi:hypothetical protein